MSATTIVVNDVEPRRQYTATGGQTVFDFPIPFFADGDLTVWLTPVGQAADDAADLLTITTEYTVTGANTQDGGQITLVTPATAGDIITIERIVDIARLSDFQTSGDLLSETLNKEQDTEIFIAQQLRQDIERCIILPKTSTSDANLELPEPEALNYLRWNSAGDQLENADGTTSSASDVTFTPAGGVASTDVQAAIAELDTEKEPADAAIAKTDEAANFTAGLQAGGSDVLVDSDIGSTVQAYDADTAKTDTNQSWTAAQRGNTETANKTGNVTLDFDTYQHFVITLTGNVTLDNPTTEAVGQSGFMTIIQDATGGRTISLGTDYETAGGSGLSLSSAANARDIVPYAVSATGSILLGAPQLGFS